MQLTNSPTMARRKMVESIVKRFAGMKCEPGQAVATLAKPEVVEFMRYDDGVAYCFDHVRNEVVERPINELVVVDAIEAAVFKESVFRANGIQKMGAN